MRALFGSGRKAEHGDDGWAAFASLLSPAITAADQLGALLHGLAERLGAGAVHLYEPDESSGRYAFVRRAGPALLPRDEDPVGEISAARAGADAAHAPAVVLRSEDDGDPSVGSTVLFQLPPSMLLPGEVRHGELIARRGASFLAWLLVEGERPVALLEVSVVAEERRLRELRATLDEWSPALAFFIGRLRQESAREETVRRLQANVEVRERVVKAMVDPLAFMGMLLRVAVVATRSHGGFVAAPDAAGAVTLLAEHGLPEPFRRELDLDPSSGIFDVDTELGIVTVRDSAFLTRTGATSLLALPLVEGGAWEGVVALAQFGRRVEPSVYALDVLRVLADQISLVLRNRRIYADFSASYLNSLRSLAEALDASGRQGMRHHAWVAELAEALGRSCGVDEATLARTRAAAEIHDVGLCAIAVDADTVTEKEHPALGAALLEILPESAEVARAVRAQHEWHNGWGFPDGLRGDQIPLEGQLLALAEFAADLRGTSADGQPFAERFRRAVQERSGTQFAPELVAAALRIDPAVLHD